MLLDNYINGMECAAVFLEDAQQLIDLHGWDCTTPDLEYKVGNYTPKSLMDTKQESLCYENKITQTIVFRSLDVKNEFVNFVLITYTPED